MKNIALLLLGLFLALPQFAQERKYSTFYEQRATLFEELPVTSRDIIFLGNSITNGCEWGELFQNTYVKTGESVAIFVWEYTIVLILL